MEKREPMQLEIDGNMLTIKIRNQNYICCVLYGLKGYYLNVSIANDDFLFKEAGIKDKYQFQKEILGYSMEIGVFPSCHTREDVITLTKAIVDYNNGQLQLKGNFFLKERKNIKFNFNL